MWQAEPICEIRFHGRHQAIVSNDIYEDPEDDLLAIRSDGSMVAVSFSDGSLMLYDINDPEDEIQVLEPSSYTRFTGGFSGSALAFSAFDPAGGYSLFVAVDTDELYYLGSFTATTPFVVQADAFGICLSNDNVLVRLDPYTGAQEELAYTQSDIIGYQVSEQYSIVNTADKQVLLFSSNAMELSRIETEESVDFMNICGDHITLGDHNEPRIRVLRIQNYPDETVFSYDPSYPHRELRVFNDCDTVMLYQYDSMRLYRPDGSLICDLTIPDADQVFDQQVIRDEEGSRLEVTYEDGRILSYSAKDGKLLSKQSGDTPDLSLYEEFYTDDLKITSALHETPVVYNRESGEKVAELKEEAELTYVTQAGPYVITEYLTMDGVRYGLILNEACETLAKLPYLCDIDGQTLYFDYPTGVVRATRIYSIDELIALQKEEQ